jgi:hypothetical protein
VVTLPKNGDEKDVVVLTRTPLQRRVYLFSQALPGIILVLDGIGRMSGDLSIHVASPLLNILAGVGIFIAVAVEERRARLHMPSSVSWTDIVGGVLVVIIGINKLHPGKTFQPGTLYMITGFLISVKGLFASWLPHRRIVFTEEGFDARISRRTRLALNWSNLRRLRIGEEQISFETAGGESKVLSLRRCGNRSDVIGRFEAYARIRMLQLEKE